jgi:hypothetical protein
VTSNGVGRARDPEKCCQGSSTAHHVTRLPIEESETPSAGCSDMPSLDGVTSLDARRYAPGTLTFILIPLIDLPVPGTRRERVRGFPVSTAQAPRKPGLLAAGLVCPTEIMEGDGVDRP